MPYKEVTCNNCGWVAVQTSRDHAEKAVKDFQEYYNALTKELKKGMYGNRSVSIKHYEKCFRCGGNYKNFRDSKPNDCPDGSTVQTIINRDE